MAFAGENQNRVAGPCEFQRAAGQHGPNPADDFHLRPAGRPIGAFPFAHLINADDWNWHEVSVAKFFVPQKKNVAQRVTTASI